NINGKLLWEVINVANEKYDYDGCIGETYNQLTVIKEVERERVRRFLCRCTCGVEKVYNGIDVFRGNTKSCGCARRNKLIERNKHNNPSKKRTNWYSKYPYDTCIGTTVNGLKFVKEIERSKYDRRRFIILCQCGIKFECDGIHIFNGSVKSCGCYKSKIISETSSTHRMTGTSEYGIWAAMMQRCNNPKHKSYHLYGGRGIEVCDEWKDFDCFIKDMGKRPSTKYTIDRIDTNGN